MYYLAYGMKTNRRAMAVRCPKAKPMGGFYLPNYRLVFREQADFRKDQNCVMPVVLWKITFECLQTLDRDQGWPHLCDRREINDTWLIYEMNGDKGGLQAPSKSYYDMIEEGYKDFGLDDSWLRSAREEASYRRELV